MKTGEPPECLDAHGAQGIVVRPGDWVLPRGDGRVPCQVATVTPDGIESESGESIPTADLMPFVLPDPGEGFVYCSRDDAEQWIAYHRDFPISRDWDLEWDRIFPGCAENETYKHLYRRVENRPE